MREAKQQRHEVVLVRDRLYIDGEQYFPPEERSLENDDEIINPTPMRKSGINNQSLRTDNMNNVTTPRRKPAKRSRVGSSPSSNPGDDIQHPYTGKPATYETHMMLFLYENHMKIKSYDYDMKCFI